MKPGSVANMGDTSLRTKKQAQIYKILLELFDKYFSLMPEGWSYHNKEVQEEFYKYALYEITRMQHEENENLFAKRKKNHRKSDADKTGQRARTWTNALVKNGFLNDKR